MLNNFQTKEKKKKFLNRSSDFAEKVSPKVKIEDESVEKEDKKFISFKNKNIITNTKIKFKSQTLRKIESRTNQVSPEIMRTKPDFINDHVSGATKSSCSIENKAKIADKIE